MSAEQSLAEINWSSLCNRSYTPSPAAWEDQVLYFVMVDRFSDGNEIGFSDADGHVVTTGTTPAYTAEHKNSAVRDEKQAAAWRAAGDTYCGGNLAGLQSKLGYLKRLGITTLWLSPVLKQTVYDATTYHGYGTQNFLEIDPHFGTKEQLRSLVDEAHSLEMYVVLDIIVNHVGNIFTYAAPDQTAITGPVFNDSHQYPVIGFNDAAGQPSLPFGPIDLTLHPQAWPDGAIWPNELQHAAAFSRRGCIDEYEVSGQYLHGDFMKLKDLHLGEQTDSGFEPSVTLEALTTVYKYWLAYTDLDGFRLDAVKHMEQGAVAYFIAQLQEFARQLGKHNFYIIGEVAGGRVLASEVMRTTRLNAVVAVDDVPGTLEALVKGRANPEQYFSFFADYSSADHWQRHNVVTMYDDHDQIRNGYDKARFAAGEPRWTQLAFNALATLVTTSGIPSIYYGSEQAFDGEGGDDNYIREAMFGGAFGAFRSTDLHCFDENNLLYQQLTRLLTVRQHSTALRRGAQQLLTTAGDGEHFGFPRMIGDRLDGVIAWLRKSAEETVLCAMNTDVTQPHTVAIKLPTELRNRRWWCLFSTANNTEEAIELDKQLTVPSAGFVVYRLL